MIQRRLSLINKEFISLIFVLTIATIIFFSNDSKYVDRIENISIDFLSFILYPKQWYENILIVKNENKVLKQNLVQLKMYNAKLNNYRIENEKLRQMLSFKEAYDKISLVPANIVNHNFSSSPSSVIVDVGKNENIFIKQPVIDMYGLVGKTISVGKYATKVHMIIDKNFAVTVKVGNEMQVAIFKPTNGKYGILEGVLKSTLIKENDIIYTSSISEIFPPDIPVCKVINVSNNQDKPYLNIQVEILANLNNLNYVSIIQ